MTYHGCNDLEFIAPLNSWNFKSRVLNQFETRHYFNISNSAIYAPIVFDTLNRFDHFQILSSVI